MKNPFQSRAFIDLMQQAQLHQALTNLAKEALPLDLQELVVGVDIEKDRLICAVKQNALASRFRFFEASLLEKFNENMPHLRLVRVQLKTQLTYETPPLPKRQPKLPDEAAAQAMLEMSEQLEDEKLAEVLKRLASLKG